MKRSLLKTFRDVADILGCPLSDLRGITLKELFESIDSPQCPVYWGSWNSDELDSTLGTR